MGNIFEFESMEALAELKESYLKKSQDELVDLLVKARFEHNQLLEAHNNFKEQYDGQNNHISKLNMTLERMNNQLRYKDAPVMTLEVTYMRCFDPDNCDNCGDPDLCENLTLVTESESIYSYSLVFDDEENASVEYVDTAFMSEYISSDMLFQVTVNGNILFDRDTEL